MPYFYNINGEEIRDNSKEHHQLLRKALSVYNTKKSLSDSDIQERLRYIPDGRKDWIITNMYRLQEEANIYELLAAGVFLAHKVNFIHQAPFCICGRIYFLDFFIPEKRIAVEIDGRSHYTTEAKAHDATRDKDFHTIGIKVVRVSNGTAHRSLDFEYEMMKKCIIPKGDKLFRPYCRKMNEKDKQIIKNRKNNRNMARKQFQNGLPKPQEFTAYIGYSANTKKLPNGAAAYCILDDKGICDQQCRVFTGKTALELCLIAVWSVMLKMPKDAIVRIISNSTNLIGALSPEHITDTNCSFLKSKIIREKHRIKSWEITKPTSALDQSYHDLVMGWAKKAHTEYEKSGTTNNQISEE